MSLSWHPKEEMISQVIQPEDPMYRTLFTFLGVLSFVPATQPSNRTLLKNPIEIRVTAANDVTVSFHVETRGGYLSRTGANGRWEPASVAPLPTQFRAFPQGPGLLFLADRGRQLHVEAWRMFGDTRHASGDGSALVVRALGPADPPEVIPTSTVTTR